MIVATDFSKTAHNACMYAADMAAKISAELVLFHVIPIPLAVSEIPVEVDLGPEQEEAVLIIRELQKQIASRVHGRVATSMSVHVGTFFYELNKLCERIDPFLVIMGSQGSSAVEQTAFGEHSVYTMKHLSWPVITIPPGAWFGAVKTIGLACDFEHVAQTVPVEQIAVFVRSLGAKLHILNIDKKISPNPDTVFESALLQDLFHDLKPTYDLLAGEKDDRAIIEFAEKNKIDLLIVLPKRHSLIDRLLHQSHTRQFVLYSSVPVLALHKESNKHTTVS